MGCANSASRRTWAGKPRYGRSGAWLVSQGFPVTKDDVYLALKLVMMPIGGGVQERLGYALRRQLSYTPAILCLGAALAFLSGGQANIPPSADKLLLGWLFRIVYSPKRYFPRYWAGLKSVPLVLRYVSKLPLMRKG